MQIPNLQNDQQNSFDLFKSYSQIFILHFSNITFKALNVKFILKELHVTSNIDFIKIFFYQCILTFRTIMSASRKWFTSMHITNYTNVYFFYYFFDDQQFLQLLFVSIFTFEYFCILFLSNCYLIIILHIIVCNIKLALGQLATETNYCKQFCCTSAAKSCNRCPPYFLKRIDATLITFIVN